MNGRSLLGCAYAFWQQTNRMAIAINQGYKRRLLAGPQCHREQKDGLNRQREE